MKTTHTVTTDDLDGSDEAETVYFAYQGVEYSIDLVEKNTTKLEKALSPYLQAATRLGGRKRSGSNGAKTSANGDRRANLSAVRAWAREHGYEVSDRGRISADIQDAYNAS